MKPMCCHEKQHHMIGDHNFLYCDKCNAVWHCKPLISDDDPE